jgi:hypothetical protein
LEDITQGEQEVAREAQYAFEQCCLELERRRLQSEGEEERRRAQSRRREEERRREIDELNERHKRELDGWDSVIVSKQAAVGGLERRLQELRGEHAGRLQAAKAALEEAQRRAREAERERAARREQEMRMAEEVGQEEGLLREKEAELAVLKMEQRQLREENDVLRGKIARRERRPQG